jgi:hypothetical protein
VLRQTSIRRGIPLFCLSGGFFLVVACGSGSQRGDGTTTSPCSVIASEPPDLSPGGPCLNVLWEFNGTPTECSPEDAALTPLSVCAMLCPPLPGDAGAAFGNAPLAACFIQDIGTPPQELACLYGDCG